MKKGILWIGAAAIAAVALIACGGGDSGPNNRQELGGLYGELEHMTVLVNNDTTHPRGYAQEDARVEIERLRLFSDVWILPEGAVAEAARDEFYAALTEAHMVLTDVTLRAGAREHRDARNRLRDARDGVQNMPQATNAGTVVRGSLQAAIARALPLVGQITNITCADPNDCDPFSNDPDDMCDAHAFGFNPDWTDDSFRTDVWLSSVFMRGNVAPFDPFVEPAPAAGPATHFIARGTGGAPGGTMPDGPWIVNSRVAPTEIFTGAFSALAGAISIRDNRPAHVNEVLLQATVDGMAEHIGGLVRTLESLVISGSVPFVRIGFPAGADAPAGQGIGMQGVVTSRIRAMDHFPGANPSDIGTMAIPLVASHTRFIHYGDQFRRPQGMPAAANVTHAWRFVDANGTILAPQPTLTNGGIVLGGHQPAPAAGAPAAENAAIAVDVIVGSARDARYVRLFHGWTEVAVNAAGAQYNRFVPFQGDNWHSNVFEIDLNFDAPAVGVVHIAVDGRPTDGVIVGPPVDTAGQFATWTGTGNSRQVAFTGGEMGNVNTGDATIELNLVGLPAHFLPANTVWTFSGFLGFVHPGSGTGNPLEHDGVNTVTLTIPFITAPTQGGVINITASNTTGGQTLSATFSVTVVQRPAGFYVTHDQGANPVATIVRVDNTMTGGDVVTVEFEVERVGGFATNITWSTPGLTAAQRTALGISLTPLSTTAAGGDGTVTLSLGREADATANPPITEMATPAGTLITVRATAGGVARDFQFLVYEP
jgi:hypothetical protein